MLKLDDLATKHCPLVGKPCLLDNCLAFSRMGDLEWDDTRLQSVEDPHAPGEFRDAEVATGVRYKGAMVSCSQNVFNKAVFPDRDTDGKFCTRPCTRKAGEVVSDSALFRDQFVMSGR